MKNVIHMRLLVALLDGQHQVKGVAVAEGQPRYALRTAVEKALALCALHQVERPRLVIIPAGHGTLAAATDRAVAFSKAGQALQGMAREEVLEMGRRAAFVAFCGRLAEEQRVANARCVNATRVA